MNHHGVTINEAFDSISYAINVESYNTMDLVFNIVFSSLFLGAAVFIGWMCYSMIKIFNS